MVPVALGIGSNLGDPVRHVVDAVRCLEREFGPVELSPLYRSSPMYVEDQPDFINAVAVIRTHLSPRALLRRLKEFEQTLGREAGIRYGPRAIDLDLLLYGSLHYRCAGPGLPTLEVPHPRMTERLFVMRPLQDVAPWFAIPGVGISAEIAENVYAGQWIVQVEAPNELAAMTVRKGRSSDADF